jgi:hypothetical protein
MMRRSAAATTRVSQSSAMCPTSGWSMTLWQGSVASRCDSSTTGNRGQRGRVGRRHPQRFRGRIRTHLRGELSRARAVCRRPAGLACRAPRVLCCWVQTPTTRTFFGARSKSHRRSGAIRSKSPNPLPPTSWQRSRSVGTRTRIQNSRFSITRTNCNVGRRTGSEWPCTSRDSCRVPD